MILERYRGELNAETALRTSSVERDTSRGRAGWFEDLETG